MSSELEPVAAELVETRVISGASPEQIIANAQRVAVALSDLITRQGMFKQFGKSRHLEVGAWQAAGALLGAMGGTPLHAETVLSRPCTDLDGNPGYEARVEIRDPDGRVHAAAEAMCSRGEVKWQNKDDYALRSMAETRAESRAFRKAIGWVAEIAGYQATPAEEMNPLQETGTLFGPMVIPQNKELTMAAMEALSSPEAAMAAAQRLVDVVGSATGIRGLPGIVADAFVILAEEASKDQPVSAQTAMAIDGE